VVVGLARLAGVHPRSRPPPPPRGKVIAEDETSIPVDSIRPNGPDCPPICRFVRSRMDLATNRLEHDPSPL
jgi:hypothetical protein